MTKRRRSRFTLRTRSPVASPQRRPRVRQRQDERRMRRARRQRRHLVMREVDATLARPVPRKVAHVAGRIAREATIVDRDVEDAGQDPQRAKDDRARLPRREIGHPILDFRAPDRRDLPVGPDRSDVVLPRPLERHVVRGLRHRRLLRSQPAVREHPDRNPRRGRVDVLALRLRHRDHGEVQLRFAHRREAALLRLGAIRLAIAHAVAAALRRFVRGDAAHLDLRSCRLDGQYRASVGH